MIELQKRGAAEQLDASYSSLFRELTGVFRSRGLGAEEARDLAQESLVRTFVHLKRHGQTRPDLRPLAHTIAKRLYVERGRRARPHFVDLPEAEDVADPGPLPADEIVAMEEQRSVQNALRSLAPRHRRVISLWMSGARPAEIARELGIKRNAADALLHRARRQLASKLDPSRATLGLVGLFVLRLRSATRRLTEMFSGIDPSGAVAQAGAGLAVAGIAAVVLVTTPGSNAIQRTEVDRLRTPVVQSQEAIGMPQTATEIGSSADATEPDAPSREVDNRFTIEPGAGEGTQGPSETWLVYRDDGDDHPSMLAPVLDPVMLGTCRTAAGICEGDE